MSVELIAQLVIVFNTLAIFALGVYQWKKPRAKPVSEVKVDDAGAAKQISEAWRPLVDSLQAQLSDVKKTQTDQAMEITQLRVSVRELRRGAFLLVEQIEKAGLSPVWRPEPERS